MLSLTLHIFIFLLMWQVFLVYSYSMENITSVRKYVLESKAYDKLVRPRRNQSEPTDVQMMFSVDIIHEFDEIKQSLKLSASIRLGWVDEGFTWDPSSFDGVDYVILPSAYLWTPDVTLKYSLEDITTLGNANINLHVTSDGLVTWDLYQIFTSPCEFDIAYFPFDTQKCQVEFVTLGSSANDIRLISPENGEPAGQIDNSQPNAEWVIRNITADSNVDSRPKLSFTLTLKRYPEYTVCNIIMPLGALMVLSVSVFLIPSGSVDNVCYSITVFLTFTVFSEIVHNALPPSSKSSILMMLIVMQMFMSAGFTFISIILVRLVRREDAVPTWLLATLGFRCKVGGKNKVGNSEDRVQPIGDFIHDDISVKTKPAIAFQDVGDSDAGQKEKHTWPVVIGRIELILFTVFLIADILMCAAMFDQLVNNE